MFCIAAFIIFAILGIFSASYRDLAKKAWYCVGRKLTLKPCDINFAEEMKGRLLGKLVLRKPRLARFLGRWIDWLAFVFVVLSIWSLFYVANAGLNLWVYDTCRPTNVESCSLGGEACGVDRYNLKLRDAIADGRVLEWAVAPIGRFFETISRVPDRMRTWDAKEYLPSTATFYQPKDDTKPFAIEALDPSCSFCKKLFTNIKQAGFEQRYNFSYLLYPIPTQEGYKFSNSYLMASYIEATKKVPLPTVSPIPPDWKLLDLLFANTGKDAIDLQTKFRLGMTSAEAEQTLRQMLRDIGYTNAQVERVASLAHSPEIIALLNEQKVIVEDKLRTIKIPTLVFGGRRYDRVVDVETLKK